MVLTAAMIATAMGGECIAGAPDQPIDGFSIDSRSIVPGDLFFAISAVRDGHEFVGDALKRGAVGAVVRAGFEIDSDRTDAGPVGANAVIIHVSDTTVALQDLARFVRRESRAIIIAITGSAGKTTTKELIAELLSARYQVVKNRGNLNNHLGLPLSLLELRHGADAAVMELGMNHAGEIRLLEDIAKPSVRVWTNVGDAHLGHFASRAAIADAKAEILAGASSSDLLVCNADDPLVMARASSFAGRTVTFGTADAADVRATALEELGIDGARFRLATPGGSADVVLPLLGAGNVSNVLAAAAVATELGVPMSEIVARVQGMRPAPHRGAVVRLSSGITLIDDSYNSSPSALRRALDVVARETRFQRKAAVLGEMLELGSHSVDLHKECGRAAAAVGLTRLVAVGGAPAQALAEAATHAGMSKDSVTWVPSSADASELIVPWLRAGDLVLVKGSRGTRTDIVVDRISGEHA
jgi:UDP-N-acetylmuramoyl-tripeptide--D-alanyl-D-alanine ligase